MKSEFHQVTLEGKILSRFVMLPNDGVAVRAVILCYHGQGDHAERYHSILHAFTQRGVMCVMTELPGHGYSPGKRGHCGDAALLDAVIADTLTSYVKGKDLRYGVMGHSMGGLLALRHLVLAGRGDLPVPSFAWISSPLVRPDHGRSERFLKWVNILAKIIPSWTISTKVKANACQTKTAPPLTTVAEKPALWHSKVSLAWGCELIRFAKDVQASMSQIPQSTSIFLTQGSEDTVCPPEHTRALSEELPSVSTTYLELEGMLHEPFKGEGSEKLFAALGEWLDELFSEEP